MQSVSAFLLLHDKFDILLSFELGDTHIKYNIVNDDDVVDKENRTKGQLTTLTLFPI